MRQIVLFLGLLLLAPLVGFADQETPSLAPGARVRVSLSKSHLNPITRSWDQVRWEGTLVALNADTLVLRHKGQTAPLAIPLSHVKRFEVSLGKTSHGKNAMKGAGIGFLSGGVIIGTLIALSVDWDGLVTRRELFTAGFLGGSILGGGAGAIIGAATGAERWERVPLERVRMSIAPRRGGGVRLAASFNF